MIPRLGDGNQAVSTAVNIKEGQCLENDSPSRGRKPVEYLFSNGLKLNV